MLGLGYLALLATIVTLGMVGLVIEPNSMGEPDSQRAARLAVITAVVLASAGTALVILSGFL